MLSSISCPGWPIGVLTTPAGVTDEQCAAVITCRGVTRVPVHWKFLSMTMCATYGYSPGSASLPPTTAWAGALSPARAQAW